MCESDSSDTFLLPWFSTHRSIRIMYTVEESYGDCGFLKRDWWGWSFPNGVGKYCVTLSLVSRSLLNAYLYWNEILGSNKVDIILLLYDNVTSRTT